MNLDGLQSARTEQLHGQIKKLAGRDIQLWSVGMVIMLIFAAGFLVVTLPHLVWTPGEHTFEPAQLVQLVIGLFMLVLIFSAYVFDQKRTQHRTHEELIREIVFNERLESFSLVDPLTQSFNRRYLDQILPKEINRANRRGTSLTFLLLEVDGWSLIGRKFGELVADQLLIDVAQVLKSTFRGSDTVLRYDAAKFLVLLPETNEPQANFALTRLLNRVDTWNVETQAPYEMAFNGGMASYASGTDVPALLQKLERNVQFHSQDEPMKAAS
ncbi:MAG: GGDEF domain-containing protein [Acidobacteriia bacterium]|nr:GGDEF domain-containing protein [Terriglobia bacterium]